MFAKVYKIVLNIFLFGLILRLFCFQILKGQNYYELSVNNYLRVLPLPGYRGNILDRYGREIAKNKLVFKLQVLPDKLRDRKQVFKIISQEFNLKPQLLKVIYKKRFRASFSPVTLVENIGLKKAIVLKEKYRELSGVMVVEDIKRDYLYGKCCCHILGYLGKISPAELDYLKPYGYRYVSLIGKSGVEKTLEPYLKGEDGGMLVKVDNRGRIVEVLNKENPKRGLDVYLTIDLDLQKKAQEILGNEKGCFLVLNVNTGEILVMASSPGFSPGVFLNPQENRIESLLSAKSQPLINRCIQSEYPLGSIFKLVVTIAGLESGKISPDTQFFCPGFYELGGRKYKCWKEEGHGWQKLKEAITHSCNVYFYQAGLKVGADNIVKYAHMLGFGEKTGIDLPFEKPGLLPTPAWKLKTRAESWFPGDTLNLSIGQGYLLVTPIQVLRFIAAIANGGYLLQPFISKSISGEPASVPVAKKLPLSKSTLKFLKSAMKEVVNSPTGTGQLAKMENIVVAGKTATAQVFQKTPHAWFACFAPYKNPEIALVVCVEHGGGGGFITARMAKEFLKYYFERKNK